MSFHLKEKLNNKTAILATIFILALVLFEYNYLQHIRAMQQEAATPLPVAQPADVSFGVQPTAEELENYDPNTLSISIASELIFDNKSYTANAQIHNKANYNHYFFIDITLDDTGETIFVSEILHTDHVIDEIVLTNELPVGLYAATATFKAYSYENNNYITSVKLGVDVIVVNSL